MSKLTRAGAITVAIFSSIGVAAGQNAPSPTTGTARARSAASLVLKRSACTPLAVL